jgi:mono/diheme cytochrome c family protein
MKLGWPLLLLTTFAIGQGGPPPQEGGVRGRYLTHQVAMCVQCHTPRDGQGQLRLDQQFRGAPMPVRAPFPSQEWALTAPNIAGLTGFTNQQIRELLTQGRITGRQAPLPPMPSYRLTIEDADAIIAYLRSL